MDATWLPLAEHASLPAIPLTKQGKLLGTPDTMIADSDYPNFNPLMVGFPDPYLVHAFAWQNGL